MKKALTILCVAGFAIQLVGIAMQMLGANQTVFVATIGVGAVLAVVGSLCFFF